MKFGKMTKFKLIAGALSTVLVALIPLLCGLFDSGAYLLNVINYVFVYIIASTGLNIMTGYSGQINLGGAAIRVLDDGWTVVTADGLPSAHYENTVLITHGDPEILTPIDGDGFHG